MFSNLRPVLLALLLVFSTVGTVVTIDLDDQTPVMTSARSTACPGAICLNDAVPNPNGHDAAA